MVQIRSYGQTLKNLNIRPEESKIFGAYITLISSLCIDTVINTISYYTTRFRFKRWKRNFISLLINL